MPLPESLAPNWANLAQRILDGEAIQRSEALAALKTPDDQLLTLLDAAYTVRRRHFGKTVQLYYLINAKSGLCPEDCNYCTQSKISTALVEKYPLLSRDQLMEGARRAVEAKACTYCIVASGRGPTERELDHVADTVREIKETYSLRICACLGLLKDGQAERLKDAGVDRFNHNLNTGEKFHEKIVSTHTYEDRVRTIEDVKEAGISPCAGGIIGMGERHEDVVDMAFALRDLQVESIPVNFYHPVDGTPLAHLWTLDPRYCLKVLAMFRFVNPDREIRIAGGRELHLGALQPLGLYAANSIFVSDYLTTKGQTVEDDLRMIKEMGFEVANPAQVKAGMAQAQAQEPVGVGAE